jgi:N-methylhydantoinase A
MHQTHVLVESREAMMRYRGQGHEIAVPLPNGVYRAEDRDALREWFEAQYTAVFGRIIPGLEVESLTWTLTLATEWTLPPASEQPASHEPTQPGGQRRIFDPGSERWVDASVYIRADLAPGVRLEGPAVIVETETATVVPPSFTAMVTAPGHLMLTRNPQSEKGAS